LIWSRPAIGELRQIRAWIARDSPRYAEATTDGIRTAARRAARFPESGRIVPESQSGVYREVFFGVYRIIYEYDSGSNQITIAAVMHGSRLITGLPQVDEQ
jgi:toxin ParE1/3/4